MGCLCCATWAPRFWTHWRTTSRSSFQERVCVKKKGFTWGKHDLGVSKWLHHEAKNGHIFEPLKFFWKKNTPKLNTTTYIHGVTLRLKPFHPWGFQLLVFVFILCARLMVLSLKTETFLRATSLIPQFRRYPGLQREIVRATLEKFAINASCRHCCSPMESLRGKTKEQ